MADQILLDPNLSDADVVRVDGRCFYRVGGSSEPPDTFAIEAEFQECHECESGSDSSRSSMSLECAPPAMIRVTINVNEGVGCLPGTSSGILYGRRNAGSVNGVYDVPAASPGVQYYVLEVLDGLENFVYSSEDCTDLVGVGTAFTIEISIMILDYATCEKVASVRIYQTGTAFNNGDYFIANGVAVPANTFDFVATNEITTLGSYTVGTLININWAAGGTVSVQAL